MDLTQCREKIDELDRQLVALFAERMETAAQVAAYKKEHGLPVLDAARERQKLRAAGELAPEAFRDDTETLYRLIFEIVPGFFASLLIAVIVAKLTTEPNKKAVEIFDQGIKAETE